MRVMLVDDSEVDRLYTRILLERCGAGYEVLPFESPRAALDHLTGRADHGVQLVLLDINMPGMSGFEFIEAWERLDARAARSAAVVMLSSSPHTGDTDQARRYACVRGYITKPIGRDEARALRRFALP